MDPPQSEQIVKLFSFMCSLEISRTGMTILFFANDQVVDAIDMHSIVMSYLLQNGYFETVDSLASFTGIKQPAFDRDHLERIKQIVDSVLERKTLKAIELTEQLAPGLLEKNKDLQFDLICLHFVQLVYALKLPEALEFARTRLRIFRNVQEHVETLKGVAAFLVYEDPERYPMSHLLSSEHLHQVADNLNRAILERTPMDRIIKQVTVARQYLSEENGEDAFPPFSLEDFLKS